MLKAYLAGPIEFQKDFGKGWRKEITPRLLELGIEAIDPARKAIDIGIFTGTAEFVEAKKAKNWSELSNFMHRIWVIDKNWVDEADFLIIHCKDDDHLSGTIREMHEAYESGKPIFLVVDGDPRKIKSHTLYMALRRGKVFSNFDELFDYLKQEAIPNQSLKKRHIDLFQITQKLLIVNNQNQLLILKAVIHGLYDLPGGRLDMQEFDTPLSECLKREVKEELGGNVKLKINYNPIALGREKLWDMLLKQDHYRRIFIVGYEARYLSGEIKLSDEHESYKWVDIKTFDPEGQFRPGHGALVQEFLRKSVLR